MKTLLTVLLTIFCFFIQAQEQFVQPLVGKKLFVKDSPRTDSLKLKYQNGKIYWIANKNVVHNRFEADTIRCDSIRVCDGEDCVWLSPNTIGTLANGDTVNKILTRYQALLTYVALKDSNKSTPGNYVTLKRLLELISFYTTGKLTYISTYNASTNLWPSTGAGGGAIKKGDWWDISVQGVLGGVTMLVNNKIYALTDNPGQAASNWDYSGLTDNPAISRLFGHSGTGSPLYTGRVKTKGACYGGSISSQWPTSIDSTINFDANVTASTLWVGLPSGAAINGNSYKMYSYSTVACPLRVNSGSSNNAIEIANSSNGNGAEFTLENAAGYFFIAKTNTVTKLSADHTGKIVANGGVSTINTFTANSTTPINGVLLQNAAKAWDDIAISDLFPGAGTSAPAFTTGWAGSSDIGANYYQGTVSNDIEYFKVQIPHCTSVNDSVSFHLHGGPTTTPTSTDSVVLLLTRSYAEIGAVFPTVTTTRVVVALNGVAQWQHQTINLLTLTGGTGNGLSGIYNCSVKRLQDDPSDTYTSNWGRLSIDCHGKIQGFGSRFYNAK